MPKPPAHGRRYSADLHVHGKKFYLGRWTTRKAADIARDRAILFLRSDRKLRCPKESRRLGPASPTELLQAARALEKERTSSRFHGVFWDARQRSWRAEIRIQGKPEHVGRFRVEEEAARAYDRVALNLRGKHAVLNFPGESKPAPLARVRAEVHAARKKHTSSRYIGVWRDSTDRERPWVATLGTRPKALVIARYRTEPEAAIAHDRAALWYDRKRTRLNFPGMKLAPSSVEALANEVLGEVKKQTKSRFIGVSWNRFSFTATIWSENRALHLGSFDSEVEAAEAYDKAALRLRGARAKLNFDPETGEELIGRRLPMARGNGPRDSPSRSATLVGRVGRRSQRKHAS